MSILLSLTVKMREEDLTMPHIRHYKLQHPRDIIDDLSSPRVVLHKGELWRVMNWHWVLAPHTIRVELQRWRLHQDHIRDDIVMSADGYLLRYRETRFCKRQSQQWMTPNVRDAVEVGSNRMTKDEFERLYCCDFGEAQEHDSLRSHVDQAAAAEIERAILSDSPRAIRNRSNREPTIVDSVSGAIFRIEG